MSLKRIVGLVPIVYLVLLGVGYSVIQVHSSVQGRGELIYALPVNEHSLESAIGRITIKNLQREAKRLQQAGLLKEPTTVSQQNITSDTAAWLVSGKDTLFLKSTHITLKHPNGIAIQKPIIR
ncbi:MAG: hypothetical protein RIG62_18005 [Cyclobacteriaceae bacterium]